MVKDSLFRLAFERNEKRLHIGYNYKGKIMKNTLSSQMFKVNKTLDFFIEKIDSIVFELIEAVKQIKIYCNPALDKYENKLN